MKLASLLTEEQIILNMEAEEHWSAIVELVERLDKQDLLGAENMADVLDSLQAREDQISTGIGSGVAIPHAFSEKLDKVVAVFGRSEEGIDFEALDNAPVKNILLFIVPKKEYHLHLQTLAAIAKLFNNCDIRKQLEAAPTEAAILDIFALKASRSKSGRVTQKLY